MGALPDWEKRYAEAVAREGEIREMAFLGLPEQINGIDLRPITARDFLVHTMAGCPFFSGEQPSPQDIATFLWMQSVEFKAGDDRAHRAFLRKIKKQRAAELVDPIFQLVQDTMIDSPGGNKADGKSYYSWVAGLVDALSNRYGWTVDEVMRQPLKIVFQLLKAARVHESGKTSGVTNKSDRIIVAWLDEQNRSNGISRRHSN